MANWSGMMVLAGALPCLECPVTGGKLSIRGDLQAGQRKPGTLRRWCMSSNDHPKRLSARCEGSGEVE